jgi:effector-binding domain-containing protein
MIDMPQIVQTEPVFYAGLHQIAPSSEMGRIMGPGIAEVLAVLKVQGVSPNGPWFTHHLRKPTDTFDFEICFPIATPIKPSGRVLPGTWPAMKAARTIYTGPYQGLPHAWPELGAWIAAQPGLHPAVEFWERYLVNPNTEPNPENWRTELNWPLL